MSGKISSRDAFMVSQPMGQFKAHLGWYLFKWNQKYSRWDYMHRTLQDRPISSVKGGAA